MSTSQTFFSIFLAPGSPAQIHVPDYQRAYSWEDKQVGLFLADLEKYRKSGNSYYFGHFIAEHASSPGSGDTTWEIVDGQQRITTFVLFLTVCRLLAPDVTHEGVDAYQLIGSFSTVSYDRQALATISRNLPAFLAANPDFNPKKPPSSQDLRDGLGLPGALTRSQKRIILALVQIHQAFAKGELTPEHIPHYIRIILDSNCSHHLAADPSVAVNIFEMHNTRGVQLTTLEIVKALLMKFVFDHGGPKRTDKVRQLQEEFGLIYSMEEQLAEKSFRGDMTMDQLLRLHLRAVDDGSKTESWQFHSPAGDANAEGMIDYIHTRLQFQNLDKKQALEPEKGVEYALKLAGELTRSVRIVSQVLPAWDDADRLVGDVLILERDLSCQLFLIACRSPESAPPGADDRRLPTTTLALWEKLLFTRDFHEGYYNLKGTRDDFQQIFATPSRDLEGITAKIAHYLEQGFRHDRTQDLQATVRDYLTRSRQHILTQTYYWGWKQKMVYAIYKYETDGKAGIRDVMKSSISVEHILPQSWDWKWITTPQRNGEELDDKVKEELNKQIGSFIHGLGNLLLITAGENTSVGNDHPADKNYDRTGGSFDTPAETRQRWRRSEEWEALIRERGERIFDFMMANLVGTAPAPEPPAAAVTEPPALPEPVPA